MKILICSNIGKDKDFKKTKEIVDYLVSNNHEVVVSENMAFDSMWDGYEVFHENIVDEIDIMIVLGGDGTFLTAAHKYYRYQIPCLGINCGRVGYLSECDSDDCFGVLEKIIQGEYEIVHKRLIQVKFFNNNHTRRINVFNEVVIHRGVSQKMIKLKIRVDDGYMNPFYADGLLVSTTLGSSAYNLSARGPLVIGNAQCFIATPICPQSGIMPSLVVSDSSTMEINIQCKNRSDYSLSIDGKGQFLLPSGSSVYITKSLTTLPVITVKQKNKKLDHINKMFSGYIK